MSGTKTEIRAEDMPRDWPCGRCTRKHCGVPCVAMRIFYADFMHRCRVAARVETEEREEIYRRYVEVQRNVEKMERQACKVEANGRQEYADALRKQMRENKITQTAVAERIGVATRTMRYYLSQGVTEAVAARIEAAIEEILRERGG